MLIWGFVLSDLIVDRTFQPALFHFLLVVFWISHFLSLRTSEILSTMFYFPFGRNKIEISQKFCLGKSRHWLYGFINGPFLWNHYIFNYSWNCNSGFSMQDGFCYTCMLSDGFCNTCMLSAWSYFCSFLTFFVHCITMYDCTSEFQQVFNV